MEGGGGAVGGQDFGEAVAELGEGGGEGVQAGEEAMPVRWRV